MAEDSRAHDLSEQVASRATRAGLWMTAGGVVLFVAGLLAGLSLDGRLMGQPVAPAPETPNETEAARGADHPNGIWDLEKVPPLIDHGCERGSPKMFDAVAKSVQQILKLNDEQGRQVRQIIVRYHPRMEGLRQQFEPELRRLALDALGDLWPILDGEQQGRLQRILARHGKWLGRAATQPVWAASQPSGSE
ncbi:MAG: hypothetical protein JXQ73_15995 [Phycisphaerae bacterium]|nr:hypothetical protein [Phycisphaerae bacterium]